MKTKEGAPTVVSSVPGSVATVGISYIPLATVSREGSTRTFALSEASARCPTSVCVPNPMKSLEEKRPSLERLRFRSVVSFVGLSIAFVGTTIDGIQTREEVKTQSYI